MTGKSGTSSGLTTHFASAAAQQGAGFERKSSGSGAGVLQAGGSSGVPAVAVLPPMPSTGTERIQRTRFADAVRGGGGILPALGFGVRFGVRSWERSM